MEHKTDIDGWKSKERYINKLASQFSDDEATFEDLRQEGLLLWCEIIRKRKARIRPDGSVELRPMLMDGKEIEYDDVDRYFRNALWKEIRKKFKQGGLQGLNPNMGERCKRSPVYSIQKLEEVAAKSGRPPKMLMEFRGKNSTEDPINRIDFNRKMSQLRERLNPKAKRLLDLILEPPEEIRMKAEAEFREKQARRERGELVMGLNELKIHNKHYAQALGVSSATVSRRMAEIRKEFQALGVSSATVSRRMAEIRKEF